MPDKEQFGRTFLVELGDLRLEMKAPSPSLRVAFSIERDKTEIPNNIELAIWGLAPETRLRLGQSKELSCKLSAGYGDEPSLLFTGIVNRAESKFDKATGDTVLRVSAGDGQDKYESAKVSKSFSKGTSVHTVLKQLVAATGLGLGNVSQLTTVALDSGAKQLEGPYVAKGSAMFELQVFADSLGIDWSFQDGKFVGAKKGQPYSGEGPLLSAATGLIEAKLDKRGNVQGTALLLPDLIPGVAFRVEGTDATGDFVCVASTHAGDNYDEQNWTVEFHGIPLGALSEGLLPEKKSEKPPSAISTVL